MYLQRPGKSAGFTPQLHKKDGKNGKNHYQR
jgi:hypothetical protein